MFRKFENDLDNKIVVGGVLVGEVIYQLKLLPYNFFLFSVLYNQVEQLV